MPDGDLQESYSSVRFRMKDGRRIYHIWLRLIILLYLRITLKNWRRNPLMSDRLRKMRNIAQNAKIERRSIHYSRNSRKKGSSSKAPNGRKSFLFSKTMNVS